MCCPLDGEQLMQRRIEKSPAKGSSHAIADIVTESFLIVTSIPHLSHSSLLMRIIIRRFLILSRGKSKKKLICSFLKLF